MRLGGLTLAGQRFTAVDGLAWVVHLSAGMNTTTLKAIIENTYGVNPVQCDAVVIEWGADKAMEAGASVKDVAKQWRAINARRARLGVYAPIPNYNHPCFAAY